MELNNNSDKKSGNKTTTLILCVFIVIIGIFAIYYVSIRPINEYNEKLSYLTDNYEVHGCKIPFKDWTSTMGYNEPIEVSWEYFKSLCHSHDLVGSIFVEEESKLFWLNQFDSSNGDYTITTYYYRVS